MRIVVFLWLFTGCIIFSKAQSSFKKPIFSNSNLFVKNSSVGIGNNLYASTRHNSLLYNDLKIKGLQVISIHQKGSSLDNVYFVDENGTSVYHTISPTGISNIPHGNTMVYDSMNPCGASSIGESIISGLINSFLHRQKIFSKL